MRYEVNGGELKLFPEGRIDSNNAPDIEADVQGILDAEKPSSILVDAEKVEYLSSAGLRILLHLRKARPDLRIINVGTEVYEILEMTGFTQMMQIEKAYRVVSVDGCEVIGRGANGTIYRIDQDTVVKVYNNADALEDIRHEREVARLALVLGIPTAISFEVVRVGESYGSVFELLNARSFSSILAEEPDKMDWCVQEYVELLKKIHGTLVPKGKLPDMKETVLTWAAFMKDVLPPEKADKLLRLVQEVPQDDHMLHGDYHTKNLELQGDEVLLIDMDTLAVGNPVFELGSMYNAFLGFSEVHHEVVKKFQGFDRTTSGTFWKKSLAAYLGTQDEDRIREVEDKARIIGYTRLIRRSIRRGGLENPDEAQEIALWKSELEELLDRVDTLLFDTGAEADPAQTASGSGEELDVEAENSKLPEVMAFIDSHLESLGCPMKAMMQIDVAVEEIFVNIANYAYAPGKGRAKVRVEAGGEPAMVTITFIDKGVPYNPLAAQDPDVALSAEQRRIGGLGIFLVKKTMDDVIYQYKDGQNILQLKKKLS